MPKTWTEKFHVNRQPEIVTSPKNYAGIPQGEKFLISTPAEIDAYIRTIPPGRSVSFQTLKRDIALEHGVEYMCPLTAGIFTRILSELAYEQHQNGQPVESITPFWRVIDLNMPLSKKLSFGPDFIKEQRLAEGLPV